VLTSDFPRVAAFVADRAQCAVPSSGSAAIGWLRDEDLVAGVLYEHFTGASITATIALEPGAVMVRQLLWAILHYPFKQFGVDKVLAFVNESNWKSRTWLEKAGFTLETQVGDVYPDGAMMIYTMTKARCRWLEKENGQEIKDS